MAWALVVFLAAAGLGEEAAAGEALARARAWIAARQRADGGWECGAVLPGGRSSPSATALCVSVLMGDARYAREVERGLEFLRARIAPDGSVGTLEDPWDYPNYASALALEVLLRSGSGEDRDAAGRVRAYLESAQLDEDFGIAPDRPQFGGWDFGRPSRGMWWRVDLSVTAYVVCALGAAGHRQWDAARAFVLRCRADDGGFFFAPWMSKAGYERSGGEWRPRSYGSMTADALRALHAMGTPREDAAVAGALEWVARNFTVEANPGLERAPGEVGRATRYYWLHSVADALARWDAWPEGARAQVVRALVAEQGSDGSWRNAARGMMEDDPVIATTLAARALMRCGVQ
jgi:squalene-hopene/tetraprenyl-beta-curcumene cyclase